LGWYLSLFLVGFDLFVLGDVDLLETLHGSTGLEDRPY
jgi:hypothetical protein